MIERFAHLVIRWRWLVILATLLAVASAGSGLRFLEFTSDYRVFFSADNPQLKAFDTLQNTYTKNDNVLIALAPKDGNVFTRDTLAAVEKITEAAWQTPFSLRVDSISNFQHTHAEVDDLIVKDLVEEAATLTAAELAAIQAIALNEPLLVRRLIAEDGQVTGVNITINAPGEDQRTEMPKVAESVRALVRKMEAENPNIDFYVTGTVMMNMAFLEASKNDMRTLVPLMFLVVLVALWFMLRNVAGVIGTLLIIVFSIVSTLGIVGWLGLKLTPPTSGAPTIILTLAVADSVHLLISYLHFLRDGKTKIAAMAESLRINLPPIFITSITTAIGLLGMNFSDSPPLRDLGNFVALGVTLAFIFSMTFLPALMMVLPARTRAGKSSSDISMAKLADFVIRRRRPLFWGNLAVILVLTGFITRNELNDQFIEYFGEDMEFRQATDFVTDNLTGLYFIDYSLGAGGEGDISEPGYLNKVDEFALWLRTQPEVVHVSTFTDIMKRLNKNLHEDDPAWFRLPQQRDLAAQYLLLYEMSLPKGLDLNSQINIEKSATRVSVTLHNVTTREMLNLEQRVRTWLKTHAPPPMQVEGSSPAVMFTHIGKRNMDSMVSGNLWSLALVSLTLIIAFRSFKFGIVSVIPNAIPILMAYGVWGIFVGEIGLSLSVVGSMTLGIVVDDTIHFISKFLRARREQGADAADAVRYAFTHVGMAMWVLSIVLILGFAVLAFSDFKMNAGMGLLTAITFALAIVADFLFLPPLLLKLEEKRNAQTGSTAVHPATP